MRFLKPGALIASFLIMTGTAQAELFADAERLMVTGKGEEARALLATVKSDPRAVILTARSYLTFPPTAPDEAMKVLKEFLKTNKGHTEGMLEWARALREGRDHANALKTYDLLLKGNPKELRALHGKVDCYLVQLKFADAEKAARAALAIDDKKAESHYYLGKVFERRDDVPSAKAYAVGSFQKAVELAGNDTRYYGPLLFAQCMYGAGGVRDTLEKLKRTAPGDASVAFAEGLLLDGEERLREALAKFQGAVSVDYGHTFAHFALGTLYSGRSLTALFTGYRRIGRKPPSFAGFGSPALANQEFAVVRFQDPSFPFMAMMDAYQGSLQDNAPAPPTPEQAAQDKAWNNYWLLLQMRH
jgi:tetratricopeptide (TPR) repeat protein